MDKQRIGYLFKKYINKTANSAEREELMQYIDIASDEDMTSLMKEAYQYQEDKIDVFTTDQRAKMLNAILSNEDQNNIAERQSQSKKTWFKFSAVAALLLVSLTVGFLLYNDYQKSENLNTAQNGLPIDIEPGEDKAMLTLGDGSVISLSEVNDGKIAEQQGIVITKTDDGQLLYTLSENSLDIDIAEDVYNTITTPRGGQFQVILPDGTRVWLNAESSLKYPALFSKTERKVELIGEGYFEVAKNAKSPFIVRTDDQSVTVLGTHFNINSYKKNRRTETTLLEGSVMVNSTMIASNKLVSKILKPGEQAILNSQHDLEVRKVNLSNAVAWKNGLFYFENTQIEDVMEELARWYNFDFEFEGKVPSIKLWGKVYRNVNASEALDILSYFNLKYRIVNSTKPGATKKVIISYL